jgi:hypothetical protein
MLLNVLYYFLVVLPVETRSSLHDLNCRDCECGNRCEEGKELEQSAMTVRDIYTARVAH